MRTAVLLLLVAALAAPSAAQPSGAALLSSWRVGWRAAGATVGGVSFSEETLRRVEGPREAQELQTLFRVRVGSDLRLDRRFLRARLNGRPVNQVRLAMLERRLQRAYGPGYGWLRQPVFQTDRLIQLVEPTGLPIPERLAGQPAWRLETTAQARHDRIERVTLWFARTAPHERTRLLRARLVGTMPRGGSAVITTDYVSVQGLDLPGETSVDVVLPQRRRQRVFTILLSASIRFTEYAVSPR